MFKEFRIDEVFIMKRGKESAPNRVPDGSYNMVNETSTNNGITKKAYSENIFDGNSITVSVNYATTVFYQLEPYCASVNILILENDNLDAESAMYVVTMLRKNNEKYDYNNKISKDRLAETVLSFPVIENPNPDHEYTVDDIDWQYMRDRIQELERDRIQELDAYLQATGLNNYELTMDEEMALRGFFDNSICWKKFSMRDLGFSIHHGKRLVKQDRLPGNIPLITAGEANQGVAEYIGNDWSTHEDAITVDMFGNCFLHDGVCSGDDNIYFFTSDEWSMKEKEFIVAVINKSLRGKYSYSRQFRQNDADNLYVDMPCNEDGTINHEYIYIYISAVEKETIKAVVQYKEQLMSIYRSAV